MYAIRSYYGKISLNIADNIVNTTAMMFLEKKPIIIAPSMHQNMLDTVKGVITSYSIHYTKLYERFLIQ